MSPKPTKSPDAVLTLKSQVGKTVVFSTQGTKPAPKSRLLRYELTYGDGTPTIASAGLAPLEIPYEYPGPGAYRAKHQVWDRNGLTDTGTVVVDVLIPEPPNPEPEPEPEPPGPGPNPEPEPEPPGPQPSGTGLRASDLSFKGYYKIPESVQAGYYNQAGQGITERWVNGERRFLMWGDYDPAHPTSLPLLEWKLPALPPGTDLSTAPALVLVKNWGYIMDGHVITDGASGAWHSDTTWHGGRLMWDEERQGVWWTYGSSYVATVNHPNIGFTKLDAATATSFGPWRINSAGTPDMVRGQLFMFPKAWADTFNGGRRFAAQGHMNSGVAMMAHGCNARSWVPWDPMTTPASPLQGANADGAPYVGGPSLDLILHDNTHKQARNDRFQICGWIDQPGHHTPGAYDPSYGGWLQARSALWGGPHHVGPYNTPNGVVERDSVFAAAVIDIGGTHSVLFGGMLVYTPEGYVPPGGEPWVHTWYSDGAANAGQCTHGQPDPNQTGGTGVGGHYSHPFGWVYDLPQLLPVIAGTTLPWGLTPAVNELDFHKIANFPVGGRWAPPASTDRDQMPHATGAFCWSPETRELPMVCRCDSTYVYGQYVSRIGVMVFAVADR